MSNEQANTNPQKANPATGNMASGHAQKLSAKLKETWSKLSDAEIASFKMGEPSLDFFKAVQREYNISPEEAAKTAKKLDAECAAACSANAGKDSNTASGPTAKAANDSSSPLPKAANS
jgi:hypothetical protein